MEALKGKIKFYEDQVDVNFSEKFDEFQKLLGEILGLTEDILTNVRLTYKDDDGDTIEIKNEEDYKLFIEEIKKNKIVIELLVEVKEESNILIKKCSSSLFSYVEKNSGNINNLSENIKEQQKSIEMTDEIKPNIIQNEIKEEQKGIINNENNINNNIINENNINNENNEINNNINNNNILIKNNNIESNLVINNPNDKKQNRINLNNNVNIQNNNINNINNKIPNQPRNSQINNPQRPNIQNPQQIPQNLQIQNRNPYLYILSFPYACIICRRAPIYRAIFFCRECNMIICPQCELREGPTHLHPLYKAQNEAQFKDLNIFNITEMDKYMDKIGVKLEDTYKSVLGFFHKNNNVNDINNNSNIENPNRSKLPVAKGPEWLSLVHIARSNYDLKNITDLQIEQALIKTRGNIDEAVILLFGQ